MIRLGIRVRREAAESAYARLLPLLEAGAEERDVEGAVEYALYGERAALPDESAVRALAGDALVAVCEEPVADGWERAFHAHLTRVTAGGLAVRPPWVAGDDGDIVIDPGTLFGAGSHPTTRLCLELLQGCVPGGALCDWGTGTGVLAIAAARLGWDPVTAVDLEGAELVRSNARANRARVAVREADLLQDAPWAPTVVANLPLALLKALARGPRPWRLIASGILDGEVAELLAAWAPLTVAERRAADGWAAVRLEHPAPA